jgi:hypothetical protein
MNQPPSLPNRAEALVRVGISRGFTTNSIQPDVSQNWKGHVRVGSVDCRHVITIGRLIGSEPLCEQLTD